MSTALTPALGLRWFLNLTRDLPSRFQRTRTWSPQSIMIWLMLMTSPDRKTAYRSSLAILENLGRKAFGWNKRPSLSSISKARRKMTIAMCREVLQSVVQQCHTSTGRTRHRYGDRRLIAIDGSRLVTKRSADTARKLHRYKRPNGNRVHNPQGLMVSAIDVLVDCPWIGSWSEKASANVRHRSNCLIL